MNDLLRQLIQDAVDNVSDDDYDDDLVITNKAAMHGLAAYLAVNPPGPKDPIVVVLAVGDVQDVQIPYEGYSVEVRDYDEVDGYLAYADRADEQPLDDWTEIDESGKRYVSRVWQC